MHKITDREMSVPKGQMGRSQKLEKVTPLMAAFAGDRKTGFGAATPRILETGSWHL